MKVDICKVSTLEVNPNPAVYQHGWTSFPFEFTRSFGVTMRHEPCPVRIHVICKSQMKNESFLYRRGFSFMLTGPQNCEWELVNADEILKELITYFAEYIRKSEIAEVVTRQWLNMTIKCKPGLDRDGILHLLLVVNAPTNEDMGFLCIYENGISDDQATANNHYYWWILCNEMLDVEVEKVNQASKVRRVEQSGNGGESTQNVSI